jgi:hypothetical protein
LQIDQSAKGKKRPLHNLSLSSHKSGATLQCAPDATTGVWLRQRTAATQKNSCFVFRVLDFCHERPLEMVGDQGRQRARLVDDQQRLPRRQAELLQRKADRATGST